MQQPTRLMQIIRLAVLDETFRNELFANPDSIIERLGLSGGEADAVRSITPDQIHRFVGALVLHHVIPIRATRRFVVVMDGVQAEVLPPQIPIYVGPELVFGNGLHASTRLCMEALERQVRPGMKVLDVGTGTGVLAIAAARLGAGEVLAVDISEDAAKASHQNVERNHLSTIIRVEQGSLEQVKDFRPDVVVANLLAPILISLADELAHLIGPDGFLIASGLMRSQQPSVERAFREAGLSVRRSGRENEWVSLACQHRPATMMGWIRNYLRR